MSKFSFKQFLTQGGITPEERRSVLEDLFVFGKANQTPYLFRMAAWFYSEKTLFKAQYRPAKSDILQAWQSENQLELIDDDI